MGIDNGFGGFSGAAQTVNEKAVAGSLDTLQQSGQSLELYNAILPMNAEDARFAFRELSGEIHANTSPMLIGGAQSLNTMINDRMKGPNLPPVTGNGLQPLGYAREVAPSTNSEHFTSFDDPTGQGTHPTRFGVWASGFGAWSDIDGTDGTLSSTCRQAA